jgi:hypothetical protein
VFRNNQAGSGGGVAFDGLPNIRIDLVNCLFEGNWARIGGGASIWGGADGIVSGCTFVGNSATLTSAGARGGGGVAFYDSTFPAGTNFVQNSILWDNTSANSFGPQVSTHQVNLVIDYCDVEGGQAGIGISGQLTLTYGAGNVEADPLFAGPMDFRLGPTSPCIDAGDPDSPPDPDGSTADLGAISFLGTSIVFADGFESASMDRWSESEP